MKAQKKLSIVLILLLIILVSIISFVGIFYQEKNQMVNVIPAYSLGTDLSGYRKILLTVDEDDENNTEDVLTYDNYVKSANVIKTRLKSMGIEDYTVRCDESTGQIEITIPENDQTEYILSDITQKGSFEIRNTANDEVLMNNDDIVAESVFNGSHYDNMYVGYMYQSGQIQGLQQSSTVKSVLDSWYVNNIAYKGYGKYIDGNAGFCGDRRTSSVSGTETIFITYQPSTRVNNNSPSLSCEDADIYTTSGSSVGNKVLTQPIGLISTDEAMFAGSSFSNYLNIDADYWTMSPAGYPDAAVFYIDDYGNLYGTYTDNKLGVCPVINLCADVEITGEGTSTNPFKVVGAS